jgi:protein-disulfide isomerase
MKLPSIVAALGLLLLPPSRISVAQPTIDASDARTIYRAAVGESPSIGPHDAAITIIEFSDFACGFCVKVEYTLHQLDVLYPGQIRWVFRTLPLDADNILAAEAARAAHAQGHYLAMHQRLMALRGRVDRVDVETLAQDLGLNMAFFRKALDEQTYQSQVRDDERAAHQMGVSGTPMFFINGRALSGAAPLRTFTDIVEQEWQRAQSLRKQTGLANYDTLVAQGLTQLRLATPGQGSNEAKLDGNAAYKVGLGLAGHSRGAATALVTIVLWSDFQCPYCQRVAGTLRALEKQYGDKLRVVFRHAPMPFHGDAALAAEAGVEAAMQGRFWEFHDALFAAGSSLQRADLERFAQQAGLDVQRFARALDVRLHRDAVRAEVASAQAMGVEATPTMFVNGHPIEGAKPLSALQTVIDAHLAAVAGIAGRVAPQDVYAVALSAAQGEERADPAALPAVVEMQMVTRRDLDASWAAAAECRGARPVSPTAMSHLSVLTKRQLAATCAVRGINLP